MHEYFFFNTPFFVTSVKNFRAYKNALYFWACIAMRSHVRRTNFGLSENL